MMNEAAEIRRRATRLAASPFNGSDATRSEWGREVAAAYLDLLAENEQLKTKLADCYDVLQAIAVSQPSTRPVYITSALYPIVAAKTLLEKHNQPLGDEA
jgi:hypothetical protein